MEESTEKPPVFSSWKGWYWLLMSVLAVEITVLLLVTNRFA